jgi:hypothetical protein
LISWRPSSGKKGGFTTTQELMTLTKGAKRHHRWSEPGSLVSIC